MEKTFERVPRGQRYDTGGRGVSGCIRQCKVDRKALICESCELDYNQPTGDETNE